ncbi:MAG: hypothetical protein ACKPHU_21265, partial [Planctomycetaceae bacterium]
MRVFWMEIVDYIDIDGRIRDFFRSLAHRFGVFQSQHVSLHPLSMPLLEFVRPSTAEVNWKSGVEAIARHLKAILEAYRVDACQLRLLIYGRDGYGSSAGLLSSAWKDTNLIRGLHCFIESLAEAG